MARRSLPLLGGRLTLEIVSPARTCVGARYRWHGRILGVRLDFSEIVTEWVPPQRKRWRTVRGARILIVAGYELGFAIEPSAGGSAVTLDIEYELPRSSLARLLGRLLARPYSAWRLRSMIDRVQSRPRHEPDGGRAMRSPWASRRHRPSSRAAPRRTVAVTSRAWSRRSSDVSWNSEAGP